MDYDGLWSWLWYIFKLDSCDGDHHKCLSSNLYFGWSFRRNGSSQIIDCHRQCFIQRSDECKLF